MHTARIVISGPQGEKRLPINPQGTLLGRDSNCDIVLAHDSVSRKHARIFRDHFGRWVIEDLGSHNGVFFDGKRVQEHALLPGQVVDISLFKINLFDRSKYKSPHAHAPHSTITVIEDGILEDIVSTKVGQAEILSPALVSHLNKFTEYLLELSDPSDLYRLACKQLAELLNTFVAIVRLPCEPAPIPICPETLAYHFGNDTSQDIKMQMTGFHFSKRVLVAVRSSNAPVMAKSTTSGEDQMKLTIVEKCKPHIVFASPINYLNDMIDVLYVDIPDNKSPEQMFDFIEAASREINLVQKKLFYVELQKQDEAIRQANDSLKEKDRIKDELVRRLTHDIKGHLGAIQSCLFVAADSNIGPLNDKQSEFLNKAINRNKQLSNFVAELLKLTKMRLAGKVEISPFSLQEVISKSLNTVDRKAIDKSISLTSDVDASIDQIVGDEFSINEVITNLLFNAIKYTPNGKSIHIQGRDMDENVHMEIIDTGIGIPADEVANIFNEFYRGSNAKKEYEGTGLGLSIVHQIIKRHGGQISAKSKLGEGTTISMVLPKNNANSSQ